MKKKGHKYDKKMQISIIKAFVTGFLCSIGFFLISYFSIIRFVASNSDAYTVFHDYVIAEELPALREFRTFAENNSVYVDGWYDSEDIPTHDAMLLDHWVEEHHFQSLTILKNSTVNIYIYNCKNFFNLFHIPTLYAFENRDFVRPIHFEDGVYDVFINTGAASRLYLSVIIVCLLVSVLLSMLIIFIYISDIVKRIVQLDKDVSDINYERLSVPINAAGKDELSHLAGEVNNARIRLLKAKERAANQRRT